MAALILFVSYCDNVDKILHTYPEITRVIYWAVYEHSDDWTIELKQPFCNIPVNARKITTDNKYIIGGKIPYKTKITHLDDVDDYDADVEIYDNIRERHNAKKHINMITSVILYIIAIRANIFMYYKIK